MGKLKKEVRDLDGLRFMMNMLKEVRQRESGINMEISPIMNMYQVKGAVRGNISHKRIILDHTKLCLLIRVRHQRAKQVHLFISQM